MIVRPTCEIVALDAVAITSVFNRLFSSDYDTELCGGWKEPHYLVSGAVGHLIYFKEDFESSALHEAAHWLIAGAKRRTQEDYGYWYQSDRDQSDQQRFESVEIKPQALEWILSNAAAIKFRTSADNLSLVGRDSVGFRTAVRDEALSLIDRGLPPRAARFAASLSTTSGVGEYYFDVNNYLELPAE